MPTAKYIHEKSRSQQDVESLTPEHDKLDGGDHGFNHEGPLHPNLIAAYDYVDSVLETSDYQEEYLWHGWALREAFLAGISYAEKDSHA